jgi:hypothetical protein
MAWFPAIVSLSVSVAAVLAGSSAARAQGAPPQIGAAACEGRSPCRVEEVLDAGQDAAGASLYVVRVLRSPPDHPHADGSPAYDGNCAQFEWLLVSRAAEGGRTHVRPLLEVCSDGYGAHGMGDDTVEVSANRFRHTRVAG